MQRSGAGAEGGRGVARGPTGEAASEASTDPAVRWAKQREAWRRPTVSRARQRQARRSRSVDHDSIVETVLFSQFYPEFPSPVPLPQLVEVLTDLWSADGLPAQQL